MSENSVPTAVKGWCQSRLSWLVWCAAGAVLLTSLTIGLLIFRFGSPAAAFAAVRGHRFAVIPSQIDVGEGERDDVREVNVVVVNLTAAPLILRGAKSTCSCLFALGEWPITVPGGDSRSVTVNVRLTGNEPQFCKFGIVF